MTAMMFCLISLFLFHRYKKISIVFICFLLVSIINTTLRMPNSAPKLKQGVVVDVATNYYTINVKSQNILLYSKSTFNYNQTVSFEGTYEKLFSPPSKSGFNFARYMKQKNIVYRIKDDFATIINDKKSIRSMLLNRIDDHEHKHLLSKVLLNINHVENDDTISSFLLSSGIVIRTMIYAILIVLSKFFYEKTTFKIELLLYIIVMLMFKQYALFSYLIIRKLLSKTTITRLDALSLSIIVMLSIYPAYVFSLSFIITSLYALVGFIALSNIRFIRNFIIIIPIQLLTFYECDLIEVQQVLHIYCLQTMLLTVQNL